MYHVHFYKYLLQFVLEETKNLVKPNENGDKKILAITSAKRIIRSDWFKTVTNFIHLCASNLIIS